MSGRPKRLDQSLARDLLVGAWGLLGVLLVAVVGPALRAVDDNLADMGGIE